MKRFVLCRAKQVLTCLVVTAFLPSLCAKVSAQDEPLLSKEQADFFENKIRPVLVDSCYECHSAEAGKNVAGSLMLDSKAGVLEGGDSGPTIVPGKPERSLLMKALSHRDPEFAMPPDEKLADQVIDDFETWIRMGAPDPRTETQPRPNEIDIELGRQHWAFQSPVKAEVPTPKNSDWAWTNIDRFIMSAMEANNITPVGDADKRTLLRRLTFDLTGLPPTADEINAFLADTSPNAFEHAVDRLLDSPQFGEKWARHWLDVARYAESTGSTVNFYYPQAWRYRDYVIDSLNADKPYDEFIKEQLAGDLLPSRDPNQEAERMIATGFLALGPKSLNERDGLKFELDMVDEQIDVTTQAFLGITVACARCHDHKFDPIPQEDYYAMAGVFRSTETLYGTVRFINSQRPTELLVLPDEADVRSPIDTLTDEERAGIEERIEFVRQRVESLDDPVQKFLTSGQIGLLEAQLDAYDDDGNPKLVAMGVRDKRSGREFQRGRRRFGGGFRYNGSTTIGDSPVYIRGESDQPSDHMVERGTLQVMTHEPLDIPRNQSGRLELAEWIADESNPLTARVFVNRVWLQLFGKGLVPTPNDFGTAGRAPSHPELLDYLAVRFMDEGWSVKQLIKSMVMSRVYHLSSESNAEMMELDPDNVYLWRTQPRRLGAEALRDAILAVSEQLDKTPRIGSPVAEAGEGPATRGFQRRDPVSAALNDIRDEHRSIYLPIVRGSLPEALALFDAADPSLIAGSREQTTVASQGLYLLNNPFVIRAADETADSLLYLESDEERIEEAFVRFFGRPPREEEVKLSLEFVRGYEEETVVEPTQGRRNSMRGFQRGGRRGYRFQAPNRSNVQRVDEDQATWSAFCQALFASAEFQYRQ